MDKTTEQTTKTATAKPALTAEEKRAKRNEYARAYYQAHKEKLIEAVRRCQAKKKTAAKKTAAKKTVKKAVPKGKALHAIAPVKKAKAETVKHAITPKRTAKPTPEQKALRKAVEKAQKAYDKATATLIQAKTDAQRAKADLKGLKNALKAAK